MSGSALGRFRFRLKDNSEFNFNYKIITNIFHLDRRLVIYIINSVISF